MKKGMWHPNAEQRRKMSAAKQAFYAKLSPEERSARASRPSPEGIARIRAAQVGRKRPQAYIDTRRAYWAQFTPEERRAKVNPGRPRSQATREKLSAARRGVPKPPEFKANLRAYYAQESPEVRTDRMARVREGVVVGRPTGLEQAVASVLDALGVEYEAEKRLGPYRVDFFVPTRALVIEADGTYWHTRPDIQARDRRRDQWLKSQGYTVLRLSEPSIRSGAFEELQAAVSA